MRKDKPVALTGTSNTSNPIPAWFASRGWTVFDFQSEVWEAYARCESGLIHSATGSGKTIAAWGGPLASILGEKKPGLRLLWITPLRALAADTADSLNAPLAWMGADWRVQMRTGDTSSSERAKQKKEISPALITTPESLMLMLSQPGVRARFSSLEAVVVDEWHELMSTKRGTQTELALQHLRSFCPELRTWGVSATLGNIAESAETLVGIGNPYRVVRGMSEKDLVIKSLLPDHIDRFPWAGHFGTQMTARVVGLIEEATSTIVFTNTRAMAEIWYQNILGLKPEWSGTVGLHHGSLNREVRDEVELGLKTGRLRAVVSTSSLDLGVDFSPVNRVIQVGSPKGVARLLQRAGRSGHQPGQRSQIFCVPTHALELVDMASAREAALAGQVESRHPIRNPLDVLAQHLISLAAGDGFRPDDVRKEISGTVAYQSISDEQWLWTLDFVSIGGSSLRAYPEFRRVVPGEDGIWRVTDTEIAQRHRLGIGTITSDAAINVSLQSGGMLGSVEESFVARLNKGDRFVFAGQPLEFVRVKDMTAIVVRAKSFQGLVPRWGGGRLPLSSELARAIRVNLDRAREGELNSEELRFVAPILELQAKWSALPRMDEVLVETFEDSEGHHLFFYPFEGRLVHEGLAALLAYRFSQLLPITFTIACNDYGFELLSLDSAPLDVAMKHKLFSPENLAHDIPASLNAVEMARRQFREIARVAGLVFSGYPGANKSAKQVQATSGLFFDVFSRYDPGNLLFQQSFREVLERQLEESRLAAALDRISSSTLLLTHPPRATPMSFPILVDRLRDTVTSESLADRVGRITAELEAAAEAR